MSKKITIEYLKEINACVEGIRWWKSLKTTDLKTIIEASILSNDSKIIEYGNWLICRVLINEQKVKYAIFSARQVLYIYEKEYPDDMRPRKAIEAAEEYLKNPSANAADAAYYAAYHAANAAAYAAYYANYAAYYAYYAYAYTKISMKTKILRYGMSLLEESK